MTCYNIINILMGGLLGTPKRALLIGQDRVYENNLEGLHNDIDNVHRFLCKDLKFKKDHVTILSNSSSEVDPKNTPTKANIILEFEKLIEFAERHPIGNIVIIVYFAGFSGQIIDEYEDEIDGADDILHVADNEYLLDDDIKKYFLNKLPNNVKLLMLCDTNFPSNFLDLKYNYNIRPVKHFTGNLEYADTEYEAILISGNRNNNGKDAKLKHYKDWTEQYQGATTASFLLAFNEKPEEKVSYNELLNRMFKWYSTFGINENIKLYSSQYVRLDNDFILHDIK